VLKNIEMRQKSDFVVESLELLDFNAVLQTIRTCNTS
jgi:hypothetical protein